MQAKMMMKIARQLETKKKCSHLYSEKKAIAGSKATGKILH